MNNQKFDIASNQEIINKFDIVFNSYKTLAKKKFGGRKIRIPLTFTIKINGITNTRIIEVNKNNSAKMILNQILDDLSWINFLSSSYHYMTTYTKFNEYNSYFNNFLEDFTLNEDGVIEFVFGDNSSLMEARQNCINDFQEFVDKWNNYVEHQNSIAPDFTNYLIKEDSVFENKELIDKYLNLLEKYKDVLHLDSYKQIYVTHRKSGNSAAFVSSYDSNFKESIMNLINETLNYGDDIIGFLPDITIKNWNLNNFLYANVLRIDAIYNDNAIKVYKYLKDVESEGIANYYASKKPGEYCGD